jgi:hypothetical protein
MNDSQYQEFIRTIILFKLTMEENYKTFAGTEQN